MEVVVNSDIPRLKKMRGECRIWKPNRISDIILGVDYENYIGIGHEFLESCYYETDHGEWIEHKWLLRGHKDCDLITSLRGIAKILNELTLRKDWEGVERMELEDFDSTDPIHRYFLISLISDGKDY